MILRNLIFDWSGTLVDDVEPVLRSTNAIFAHFGQPRMDRTEFLSKFRLPFTEFYKEHLPGPSIEEIEPLYLANFGEPTDGVFALPHARDFLLFCRSRSVRCFLLSSTKRAHFDAQAQALGLDEFFEGIHAEVWDKRNEIGSMLDRYGLDVNETAFLGDMQHDIDTARHADVTSIALLTGYDSPQKIAAASPDITVADLGKLKKLFLGIGPDFAR
ncbi:MAG: HAD family hydrolase [Verrucomicrobiota bacterium]